VIDGIRIAPFVFAHRRESIVRGAGAQRHYLDCGECIRTLSESERREWLCGHLPRSPGQTGNSPLPIGAPRPGEDICAGYLIGLAEVHDALRAHLWWDKGQLAELVAGQSVSPLLRSYVDCVSGAIADLDLHELAERERRVRH
jgi:hypothetical protein